MANLKVSPKEAVALLNGRIVDLKSVQEATEGSAYYNFLGWCSKTWQAVDAIYGSGDFRAEEIRSMGMPACSCGSPQETLAAAEQYVSLLMKYIDEIQESAGPGK
jgi:hypothetical protein